VSNEHTLHKFNQTAQAKLLTIRNQIAENVNLMQKQANYRL